MLMGRADPVQSGSSFFETGPAGASPYTTSGVSAQVVENALNYIQKGANTIN